MQNKRQDKEDKAGRLKAQNRRQVLIAHLYPKHNTIQYEVICKHCVVDIYTKELTFMSSLTGRISFLRKLRCLLLGHINSERWAYYGTYNVAIRTDAASYPRRMQSSAISLTKPQDSQTSLCYTVTYSGMPR
jgi:hypothetical protein